MTPEGSLCSVSAFGLHRKYLGRNPPEGMFVLSRIWSSCTELSEGCVAGLAYIPSTQCHGRLNIFAVFWSLTQADRPQRKTRNRSYKLLQITLAPEPLVIAEKF